MKTAHLFGVSDAAFYGRLSKLFQENIGRSIECIAGHRSQLSRMN